MGDARIKGLAIVTGDGMACLCHVSPGDFCAYLDGERRWTEGKAAAAIGGDGDRLAVTRGCRCRRRSPGGWRRGRARTGGSAAATGR